MVMEEWTDMGKPPVKKKTVKIQNKRRGSVAPSLLNASLMAADSGAGNPPVPILASPLDFDGNPSVPIDGNPPVPTLARNIPFSSKGTL